MTRTLFFGCLAIYLIGCPSGDDTSSCGDAFQISPERIDIPNGATGVVSVEFQGTGAPPSSQLTHEGPFDAQWGSGEDSWFPATGETNSIIVTCERGGGEGTVTIRASDELTLPCTQVISVTCAPPIDGGDCEPCEIASDCGAGRICGDGCCKPESGSMPCSGDGECPSVRPVCVDGPIGEVCAFCRSEAECAGPGDVCFNNHCVGCVEDGDCESGICEGRECAECRTDAECAGLTPHCMMGQCAQCLDDSECSDALPRCGDDGICVECATETDCGGGTPFCREGRCSPCGGDSDCPSRALPNCLFSGCGPCDGDFDCDGEYTCERDVGVERSCSMECSGDSDCDDDQRCFAGRCGTCEADADCPPAAPHCGEGNLCYECAATSPCTDGRVCNIRFGQCVDCISDNDCDAVAPRCSMNACLGCQDDEDCTRFGSEFTCLPDGRCET